MPFLAERMPFLAERMPFLAERGLRDLLGLGDGGRCVCRVTRGALRAVRLAAAFATALGERAAHPVLGVEARVRGGHDGHRVERLARADEQHGGVGQLGHHRRHRRLDDLGVRLDLEEPHHELGAGGGVGEGLGLGLGRVGVGLERVLPRLDELALERADLGEQLLLVRHRHHRSLERARQLANLFAQRLALQRRRLLRSLAQLGAERKRRLRLCVRHAHHAPHAAAQPLLA
mmetsp:Transcript_6338/g.13833  ORF Transcript_6338/g.13833 Transcript_6338/m.13833 type:complete len:232 (-) Transcript_6338:2535-3230(-)